MKKLIITKTQVQKIIDSMDRVVKADGPRVRAAIKEIGKHISSEEAMAITSFAVLKARISVVNKDHRKHFMETGCKESLSKMWDLFPVGKEGKKEVKELMTHRDAWSRKDDILWHLYIKNHKTGLKRAESAVRYEKALVATYS